MIERLVFWIMKLFLVKSRKKSMRTLRYWALAASLCLYSVAMAASGPDNAPAIQPSPPASTVDTAPPPISVKPIELSVTAYKTDNTPIDLATVLKLIENQNLQIAQNRENMLVYSSRRSESIVSILPDITGSYTQSKTKSAGSNTSGFAFGGLSGGRGQSRDLVQPEAAASITLYPGGEQLFAILAAHQRKLSAEWLLKQTIQEQLATAAQDYYKLLDAYKQKQVVVQSIVAAQEQVDLNQALVNTGKGIPLNLSQAQTAFAQDQSNLVQSETTILEAEQALIDILNLDPTVHLVPNEMEAVEKPLLDDGIPMAQMMQKAMSANPSIIGGERDIHALLNDYRSTRGQLIPNVTLSTYVNKTGPDWQDLTRTNFYGLEVNADLLQNLGLQIPFQMQEKKRLVAQQELVQKALVRDTQKNVMTAFLDSQNYKSAIVAAQQAIDSAQESYDLAMGRFKAGYGIFSDALNAQAALETARSTLATAVLNYNQAQVQLVQALGLVTPDALTHGIQWQGNPPNGKQPAQNKK